MQHLTTFGSIHRLTLLGLVSMLSLAGCTPTTTPVVLADEKEVLCVEVTPHAQAPFDLMVASRLKARHLSVEMINATEDNGPAWSTYAQARDLGCRKLVTLSGMDPLTVTEEYRLRFVDLYSGEARQVSLPRQTSPVFVATLRPRKLNQEGVIEHLVDRLFPDIYTLSRP